MLVCIECVTAKVGNVDGKWGEAWTIIDGRALCLDHAMDRLHTPQPVPVPGVGLRDPRP